MSHVTAHWQAAQAWVSAHRFLGAIGTAVVVAIAIRYENWSLSRSIRRRERQYEIAKGRAARARGLSLTSVEADLLARLERPRWWRRSR